MAEAGDCQAGLALESAQIRLACHGDAGKDAYLMNLRGSLKGWNDKMRLISLTAMTGIAMGLATLASADPALGTWQTAPDKKGQIAHVQVTRCDQSLCGEIVRAYDSQGQRITTENVGKRVFWAMTRTGEGNYQGRAWVPAHDREYAAKMELNYDRLKVSGCLGPICQSQLWARVQ